MVNAKHGAMQVRCWGCYAKQGRRAFLGGWLIRPRQTLQAPQTKWRSRGDARVVSALRVNARKHVERLVN